MGGVYYLRRNDRFGQFLVFWVVATFVLYTIASEKMPWLRVNVTLPLIVLTGKFIGDVAGRTEWRRLRVQAALVLPGVWPYEPGAGGATEVLVPMGLGAALVITLLLALTVRAGALASYPATSRSR